MFDIKNCTLQTNNGDGIYNNKNEMIIWNGYVLNHNKMIQANQS